MTCPTCNGPLKMLFTSSYCEACERKGESVHAEVRTASGSRACALTSDTWTLDVTAPRPAVYQSEWLPVNGTIMWTASAAAKRWTWNGTEWVEIDLPQLTWVKP